MQPMEVPRIQAKMVDAQTFFDKFVLECDHVRVFIAREVRMEAVARLAGFAVAMLSGRIRKYLFASRSWPGPVSSEDGLKKIVTSPAGAVKD